MMEILYWALAAGVLGVVLWKVKAKRRRILGATIVIVAFGVLPLAGLIEHWKREAYAKAAWAYFQKKCETEAGEKIYRTVSGVKSVLVLKPLPPATEKDLYDQFWYGDPYSNATPWEKRGESAAISLTLNSRRQDRRQIGLDFVELKSSSVDRYVRIFRPASNDALATKTIIDKPTSKFGIEWNDISTPEDRKYWVAGSRLRIIDLADNAIVAERIGYFIEAGFGSRAGGRRPWLTSRGTHTTCPPLIGGDYSDNWFLANVFKLEREDYRGK